MTLPHPAPRLSPALAEAFAYALDLHRSQLRKRAPDDSHEPVPYLAHLLAVTALVLEHGGDEEEAIAALLHDGPEDQGGQATLDEIRRRFGDRVAEIVDGCSDTLVASRDEKEEWEVRKREYLARLEGHTSDSVLLVSMADKTHNLRSLLEDYRRFGERVWRRFSGGREGSRWYYRELLDTYRRRIEPIGRNSPTRLLRKLERLHGELEDEVVQAGKSAAEPVTLDLRLE